MIRSATALQKKIITLLFALLVMVSGAFVLVAPKANAQAGGESPLCYSNDQRANKTVRFPVCDYDGLKAGGFDMGELPNPFPPGKHCYYFPDEGGGREVDCNDPQYKNAPEFGSSTPPPISTKCYRGNTGTDGKQTYEKVNCTTDYQSQIGKALEQNKCYMIDNVNGQVTANEVDCSSPQVLAAEDNTTPIGTGTVRPGTPGACPSVQTSFFGLPTWYKYLEVGDNCAVKLDFRNKPNQIWLIALAIADILLWIAGFVAVLFVIYGGYKYITSQFDPEGTKNARDTILNALIGLAVAVLAAAIVNFVGRNLI